MTKTTTATTGEQVTIKWKQIHVPAGGNIRTPTKKAIEERAASLLDKGQLSPIIVRNGGTGEKPYTLVGGFTRMAAYELNGWQEREIMAVVREYEPGDVISRLADAWTDNMQRADMSPLDQAKLVYQLVTGSYAVDEGETAVPIEKDEIASRFQITKAHLGKLLKVHRDLDHKVAIEARRVEAPLRLLISMSQIDGQDVGERRDGQSEALQEWTAAQEALAAEGRQRAVRSDKGVKGAKRRSKDDEDGATPAALRPTKKVGSKDTALHRPLSDYLAVLMTKQAEVVKEERLRMEGRIEALRFITGDLKKLPGILAADFKALDAVAEEPEEETEEEAVEEESEVEE